jgi:hypothetical protein
MQFKNKRMSGKVKDKEEVVEIDGESAIAVG